MILLDKIDEEEWISKLNIRKNISDNILEALPLQRFYHLQKVKGVGKESYENIFRLFYMEAQKSGAVYKYNVEQPKRTTQLSLFN